MEHHERCCNYSSGRTTLSIILATLQRGHWDSRAQHDEWAEAGVDTEWDGQRKDRFPRWQEGCAECQWSRERESIWIRSWLISEAHITTSTFRCSKIKSTRPSKRQLRPWACFRTIERGLLLGMKSRVSHSQEKSEKLLLSSFTIAIL